MQGRRRLRRLVTLLALVVLMLGVFAASRSPLFDVDEVMIEGATRSDAGRLAEIAGSSLYQPLLEIDTGKIEAELEREPWVERASVDRSLTGRLTVSITERVPVTALAGEQGWLLADSDGRVLAAVDDLPAGLVPIDGARWRAEAGARVPTELMASLDVAETLPSALASHVSSVVPRVGDGSSGIELLLYGGGTVDLGDATELEDKYLAALTLLEQARLACLDRIDVRAPTVPVLTRVPNCS